VEERSPNVMVTPKFRIRVNVCCIRGSSLVSSDIRERWIRSEGGGVEGIRSILRDRDKRDVAV
jgi:hypothetical protein